MADEAIEDTTQCDADAPLDRSMKQPLTPFHQSHASDKNIANSSRDR